MKTKINTGLSLLIISTLITVSCHWQTRIAIVKNNTKSCIIGTQWTDGFMMDSILYNDGIYKEYWIGPDSSEVITLPNIVLGKASDAEKDWIYFFNEDTLNKYQKEKKSKDILKYSLLKKIEIQLNKVKEPLDTIYVNSSPIQKSTLEHIKL